MPRAKTRKDPKRRRQASGEVSRFLLARSDEGKHYCWVDPHDDVSGVPKYLSHGYEIENFKEGGVRPRIGVTCKPGEAITNSGLTLMSVSKERHDEIVEEGPFNEAGQIAGDEMHERMFKRDGVNMDRFRGVAQNQIGEFAVGQSRE